MRRSRSSLGAKLVSCVMSVVLTVGLMPLPAYAGETGDGLAAGVAGALGGPVQPQGAGSLEGQAGSLEGQAGGVSYWDHSWDGAKVVATERTATGAESVPGDGKMTSGWYYLDANVTVNGRVCLTGDTYLILGDGKTLDVKGLYVPKGSTLRIYGQSGGSGKLYSHPSDGAGIGAYSGHRGGAVEVHGGTVQAEGAKNCAGIGGNDDDRRDLGGFTMYDGTVKAMGGDSGAGIGGGRACEGGAITIYGGHVTAQGGHYGAGIGGGNGQDTNPMRGAHGGTIAIWGDDATVAADDNRTVVNATGGADAAGIGGGEGGNAGTVTINGGYVKAQGGDYSAGIGCGEGESTGVGGSVTVNGGHVDATGGKNAAGIGGGEDGRCDAVTITGTDATTAVTATGGANGAGIGAGRDGDGGTIRITGGKVTAEGKDSSAGIGGGDASGSYADYSDIEISGGTVTATGHSKGAGIGGGEYGHATVSITGGTVTANGGSSGGAGIGDGKDGEGSLITLGYTAATKDTISVTAPSYKGVVKLDRPFKNGSSTFQATSSVSDLNALAAAPPLVAWDDPGAATGTTVEVSSWFALQAAITAAQTELSVKLTGDITAGGSDSCITIPKGLSVTLNLNGKAMDRGLKNAAISDGGSAIVVEAGASLTVTDSSAEKTGAIKGGAATNGGGILNRGALALEGGTVTGNKATSGGGVYNEGAFTMSGGAVSGNAAAQWGGGVYLADEVGAVMHLDGGAISDNVCDSDGNGEGNGGGVHVSGKAAMTASGSPVVEGNAKGTGAGAPANNASLADGTYIAVTKALDAARIGVRMSNAAGNITSGLKGKGKAANFSSDNAGYSVALDGAGEAYLRSNAAPATADSWKKLQDEINSATAKQLKVIKLSGDVVNTENKTRIKVEDEKYIVIDLAGHELDRKRTSSDEDGHVIEVFEGSALTIRDTEGGGTITGGHAKRGGGVNVHEDATLTISGGTVTGNEASVDGGGVYVRGTLRMTGGAVDNNEADDTGGGIYVNSTGKIALAGASVSYNKADNDGGGIKAHLAADSSISNCRVAYNRADDNTGGGIHLDAKGKTLTIADTAIDRNWSNDDGGGVYLQNGTIVMSGGSASDNYSDNDGGGVKVTKGTTFTATNVAISGNAADDEEGGGVKNLGTTTLKDCAITNNQSHKQGGGVFNDNLDGSEGILVLENCTVSGNDSEYNGGGVYSDKDLTIIGGSFTGNFAATSGGGIFIGDDSDYTKIAGKIVVKDNASIKEGQDIFLRTKRLKLTAPLEQGAHIGVTKENDGGIGVFTEGYSAANHSDNPSLYFFSPEGLDVIRGGEGEAALGSSWSELQQQIAGATDDTTIKLEQSYTASPKNGPLEVSAGTAEKPVTIDLNGFTLNRNRTSDDEDGHVIWVKDNAHLVLMDSTAEGTAPGAGTITGGYSERGGGVYVGKDAACTIRGINIKGNKASDDGAGIYSKGALSIENSIVTKNMAEDCAGGIDVEDTGSLAMNNVAVTRNTSNDDGGGLWVALASNASFTNCEITDNISDDNGGGLYMDAKDKTLTITDSKVDGNTSSGDGAGIFLQNGIIDMKKVGAEATCSLSGNTTENDSGGIKVTSKTTFTATGVEIKDNKASGEEGGGLKNYGTTTLTGCTISGNSAGKEGGGVFNDNDGGSAGEMTIIGCTFTSNKSSKNGGGVYSDHKLTITGTADNPTTIGTADPADTSAANKASNRGDGIFIGKDAKETNIKGKIVVRNNDGEDVYLRSGQVFTLTGAIDGTSIGIIDMDSLGVFTKNYSTYHSSVDPAGENSFFCKASGAIPAIWYEVEDDGNKVKTEAQLESKWPELQAKIDAAKNGDTVTLDKDYTAGSSDFSLKVKDGYNVTIDLAGHVINRNLKSKKLFPFWNSEEVGGIPGDLEPFLGQDVGHAIGVYGDGTLTVKDSSATADKVGDGIIGGGYAFRGGGIFVDQKATLNFESGTIMGNTAYDHGGGIYVSGTLNMTGGHVMTNGTDRSGGGIYSSDSSSLSLDGVTVYDNTAGDDGGGLNVHAKAGTITKCTIEGNKATDYGGAMRVEAKDGTLKITDTNIDSNYSVDDGAGIHLLRGTVEMTRGTLKGNSSYNDGGGIKVTDNTTFIADGVKIQDNRAMTEEGGGVKNLGTTTLKNCTISGNKSIKQGGGVYNDEELTIESCKISGNSTQDVGGGIYSDDELTIRGTTVVGPSVDGEETLGANRADNKGGGIYIGSSADFTKVEGTLVVKGNEATNFGNDLYLRDGKKLTLTGALTAPADGPGIHIDLETGTGVFTKNYKEHNKLDGGNAVNPDTLFTYAVGYSTKVNGDGEAEICSDWSKLEKLIEEAEGGKNGGLVTLEDDYAAAASDDRLKIHKDKSVTVDLNGHTVNRNRNDDDEDGHVFEVLGTLTLKDGSADKTGTVTGGWANKGGGINIADTGTLNFQGGTVSGNRAENDGGGIYAHGTLNMTGGTVKGNVTESNGGGIGLDDGSTMNLSGGKVEGNDAEGKGGGIKVDEYATANIQGKPIVSGNHATKAGADVYLPSQNWLKVTGAFSEGAEIGVARGDNTGVVTNGYDTYNAGVDPAKYFKSTEGYAVFVKDHEVTLGLRTNGLTDFTDPFVSAKDQINTDTGTLSSYNWMSGISGERHLSEINLPGSHDSGMNKVDANTPNSWFQVVHSGIMAISAVVLVVSAIGAIIAIPVTGGASAGAWLAVALGSGLVFASSFAVPHDWTSALSVVAGGFSAEKAKTQYEYINKQLDEGARQIDIRLNNQKKEWDFWETNGWVWKDDGKNLWLCHGKSGGGTYQAETDDGHYLSFRIVLGWVKDFLREHPTETIMLDLRPETEDESFHREIYQRTRDILEAEMLVNNPATNEPYLYKEPGSDDYFAPYTYMPQLKDCRGKAVIMGYTDEFVSYIGGFERTSLTSESLDELDFKNLQKEMVDQVQEIYGDVNGNHQVKLPTTAGTFDDRLWYWELNCTGQNDGMLKYIFEVGTPHELADFVNPRVMGKDRAFSAENAGDYIGWVKMDSFEAKYAEEIWRTNFSTELAQSYSTITVKSGLDNPNYPDQTFKVLKGTQIALPGNIYKQLKEQGINRYFDCWQAGEGESAVAYAPGDSFKVDEDVTFTAKWLEAGKVPVQIAWKDGGDADKLRDESVTVNVTAGGETKALTLTEEKGWRDVVTVPSGAEVAVAPSWELVRPTAEAPNGQDADGQYRYEVALEGGDGYVVMLVHTPQVSISAKGTVSWVGDKGAEGKRPDSVTVHLHKNGAEAEAAEPIPVNKEASWAYDFGSLPKYENGEEVAYSVTQTVAEEIAQAMSDNYTTAIDGFSITNTYVGEKNVKSVRGTVEWNDAGDASGIRPGKVSVTLKANGEEVKSQEATVYGGNVWAWSFDDLPVTDEQGAKITYTVSAENVDGYTVKCEEVTATEGPSTTQPGTESQASLVSMYQVTYTLDVADNEKTPAKVSVAPEGLDLAYNGKPQELAKGGEAEGGKMVYALGESAIEAPSKEDFVIELPEAADAGTYHVWYYVKGDVLHTDSDPVCVEAKITDKVAQPAFRTHSVLLDGQIGVKFYMNLDELTDEQRANSSVTFTVAGRGGFTATDKFDPDDRNPSGSYYGFTCDVSSIQMADRIKATFHCPGLEDVTDSYSVADYVAFTERNAAAYEAQGAPGKATLALVRAMADYGHHVQPFLSQTNGWSIGGDYARMPAAREFEGSGARALTQDDVAAAQAAVGGHAIKWGAVDGSGVAKRTFALRLNAGTDIFLYYEMEGGASVDSATVDEKPAEVVRLSGGRYRVTVPNISAHGLGEKHKVVVETSKGKSETAEVSALSYASALFAADAYRDNADARMAMTALYRYWDAATKYLQATGQGNA